MKQGQMWKHKSCLDVSLYFQRLDDTASLPYIQAYVAYVIPSGKILESETVRIQRDQLHLWERVL